ncbi:MmgE/PrpD family protein [Bordetella genomosp. 10]|nr:MmgE/PrpD family protein [Bordetella genomosp. 10]
MADPIDGAQTRNSGTDSLVAFIMAAGTAELTADVVEKTKHHIVDTVAAMISGLTLDVGKRALQIVPLLEGRPEAGVAGSPVRLPFQHAAMVNAMLAHADETDDSHEKSKFHPGCGIVPAALALAERQKADGRDIVRAVALGYDVGARVLEALGPMPLNMAGHASHAIGPLFGCAAVAANLLGFDASRTGHLLSYAGHETSGLSCWMSDSDHVQKAFVFGAMAAKNALFSALLCEQGWTGCPEVISAERGLLHAYGTGEGGRSLDEPMILGNEILHSDIKKWCVGSPIQACLDSLEAMLPSIPADVEQIRSVDVEIQANEVFIVEARAMPNISLQHLLALFLVDRELTFDSVHDVGRMQDSRVLAVRKRISLIPSIELQEAGGRQAIVRVNLADGQTLRHHTPCVRGTWKNRMSRDEIDAKAFGLVEPILGRSRARDLLDGLWKLETLSNERWVALTGLFTGELPRGC